MANIKAYISGPITGQDDYFKNFAKTIDKLMALPISWAKGLPLRGGTYECEYYQKD